MMKSKELDKCIMTGSHDLIPVVNLGELYPSAFINAPLDERKFEKKAFVVNFCEDSGMVQLKFANEYDDMFREYWYRSSTNAQMKRSLKDVVLKSIEKHGGLNFNWLDIACNDGTLSQIVKEVDPEIHIVGVDPALNLNHKGSDVFVNDYFSAKVIQETPQAFAKFDIITNIAMFYDLQDPHPFLDDVRNVLRDDGIYVIQMTDLYGMIKSNAVDNFCHEHVAYYSLEAIDKLLKMHGLEIFDLEYNLTNGSSLRIYASHTGKRPRREMVDMLIEYQKKDITAKAIVDWYNHDICRNLYIFNRWLERQKKAGKSIALIGASTKGNTLLQMCNLDRSTIDYAMELTPIKYGKYCLGSNIPIVEEKYVLTTNPPDICVAMIWHFKESILKNFKSYIDNGGSVLFPLPKPILYTKDGVQEIK